MASNHLEGYIGLASRAMPAKASAGVSVGRFRCPTAVRLRVFSGGWRRPRPFAHDMVCARLQLKLPPKKNRALLQKRSLLSSAICRPGTATFAARLCSGQQRPRGIDARPVWTLPSASLWKMPRFGVTGTRKRTYASPTPASRTCSFNLPIGGRTPVSHSSGLMRMSQAVLMTSRGGRGRWTDEQAAQQTRPRVRAGAAPRGEP